MFSHKNEMESNLLNNYVFKLLESIEKNISNYTKDRKPNRLHRLRVDIKKIKAILSFTGSIYKVKYDRTKLNTLFLEAGKIREMQINIRVLNFVPNPPQELISKIQKKEDILTQNFIRNGSKYKMLIRNFRAEISLPKKTLPSKKIIKKYFAKETQKANKILKTKDRECLHRYRMKIKKLLFIYKALPDKIQKEIELDEAKIKKQDKKLGNWHDIYSAIKFLSRKHFHVRALEYFLIPEEKEQFNALYTNLKKKVSGNTS